MSLENRIAALETELAEIKKLKGVPGGRGPAGDISAAVVNAQREVRDAEERLATKAAQTASQYAADVAALRKETADAIKNVQAFVDGRIENAVVLHTVKTLEDYGVVSGLDGQRIKAS
jgi:cell division septum initiation protein DivIVA